MEVARKHGTIVSYDLNYRESLWKSIGGQAKAVAVNRELAPLVDVMIGNEEDFTAALGFEVEGQDEHHSKLDVRNFQRMIERAVTEFPNFKVVATTLQKREDGDDQRLGRRLLYVRRTLPGAGSREPRDSRSHWWRRFVCVRIDLRISDGSRTAVGGRVWRGARRAGDDDAGRYDDGDVGGS